MAVATLRIEHYIPNGSASSYTDKVDLVDLGPTSGMWQAGLFIIYALLGFIELASSVMDALELNRMKKQKEMEE